MSPLPFEPHPGFPYRLGALVGEGAMGSVYRAVEVGLDRPVAIKVPKPQLLAGGDSKSGEEYRRRFLLEARAAAALSHPGVATIYRIGEEGGLPFIAMEWLEGRSLERVLEERGPLAPTEVVRLGAALLDALEAAHRAGIVHRDVKPANLMLLADGRLKVTDFGIARWTGSDLVRTQTGSVFATPSYASPEQLRAEPLDGRSDVFAVGVVLFELLTGRLPFDGAGFFEMAAAILQKEPLSLSALRPELPAGLVAVVERALAKRREERYSSAEQMAGALTGALGPARTAPAAPTVRERPGLPSRPAAPPTFEGLPPGPAAAALEVASRWPGRQLGHQQFRPLLEKLLDHPLHAPAFTGLARLGAARLWIAGGVVLGALDAEGDLVDDEVLEALVASGEAALHPLPADLPPALVILLAGFHRPARLRQEGLDSTFVNLPALAARLEREGHQGVLCLDGPAGTAWVLLVEGRPAAQLFAGDWAGLPLDRPWQELVEAVPVTARLEDPSGDACFPSYRRQFRDLEVPVAPGRPPAVPTGTSGASPPTLDLRRDPVWRFLTFATLELGPFFAERERTARWKYLAEWWQEVASVRLHHDLVRPDSGGEDSFDLVTFDPKGKVLHVCRRRARVGLPELQAFRADVVSAKEARSKTGDIGGALLVARAFEPEVLGAYRQGEAHSGSGKWLSIEESFTGYEGFVRVGARRGFHLLLVEEGDESFRILLP
ncbi:MAG TPA: protein kinase [Thermoanaerobaculia bacterium]|nr:protein kinase [Thermoanaerobaculia bacterium]